MKFQRNLVTMDFARIAYEPESVGRIFKLDEPALDARLCELEKITDDALVFTMQNGLRRLLCTVQSDSERSVPHNRLLYRIYRHN